MGKRQERYRTGGHKWPYSIPRGVRQSAIPVTLVGGPPGAGKSTYVKARAGIGDVVIDYDECAGRLGINKWSSDQDEKRRAFALRDSLINSLATSRAPRAWLIVCAPSPIERAFWLQALGYKASWIVLDVPASECKRRMQLDSERLEKLGEINAAVDKWWREYSA